MKKFSPKDIIMPTVVLLVIGLVSAGILGFVNNVTAPIIAESDAEAELHSRQIVLPDASKYGETKEKDGVSYAEGFDDGGNTVGYVFISSGKGYGGDVLVMTGVNNEGVVTGICILSINETPGLGMNAKKEAWYSQFKGKSGELTVVKGGSASESEIQAITSATITSKAVTSAVNKALAVFNGVNGTAEESVSLYNVDIDNTVTGEEVSVNG